MNRAELMRTFALSILALTLMATAACNTDDDAPWTDTDDDTIVAEPTPEMRAQFTALRSEVDSVVGDLRSSVETRQEAATGDTLEDLTDISERLAERRGDLLQKLDELDRASVDEARSIRTDVASGLADLEADGRGCLSWRGGKFAAGEPSSMPAPSAPSRPALRPRPLEEEPEARGPLAPLVARGSLHVVLGVGLVHDLHSEERLDDVLDRREPAVPPYSPTTMAMCSWRSSSRSKSRGSGRVSGTVRIGRLSSPGRDVVAVVGEGLEDVALEDEPGDVVAVALEEGDAREGDVAVGDLLERGLFREGDHHRARGHDVARRELVEAEEALEDPGLLLLEDPLLDAEAGERGELGAADLGLLGAAGEKLREGLREHDERVEDPDGRLEQARDGAGELPPVDGAERLGMISDATRMMRVRTTENAPM
jgi:hypothetical protein